MNRIDRLFGILLQLQSKKRVHSKELAAAFEVSERTIFRDIARSVQKLIGGKKHQADFSVVVIQKSNQHFPATDFTSF
jgi:DeoR/GlpR family transcriptional regulator of sugar metabolism